MYSMNSLKVVNFLAHDGLRQDVKDCKLAKNKLATDICEKTTVMVLQLC